MKQYYFGERGRMLYKENGRAWMFSYYHLDFIDVTDMDVGEIHETTVDQVREKLEEMIQRCIQEKDTRMANQYRKVINRL